MAAVAAGCTSQPPEYAWSHSASGEYLFAFDVMECSEAAADDLQSPRFFACMTGRGYFLVDPATGLALAHPNLPATGGMPQASRASDTY